MVDIGQVVQYRKQVGRWKVEEVKLVEIDRVEE